MEKLEHYLDQVCRRIGGPRPLRQHVRQELREHLLDAVAQHKAAGATDEAALERALEEFGKPDDVRSELEGAHGQRMMAVVIDKAMQWKEMTMKAKWLWVSWAYLALVLVIALEVLFIAFGVMFIVPKLELLIWHGLIDPAILDDPEASWMPTFLFWLQGTASRHATWYAIAAAALWGLFEWRVRSDNKSYMRLAALGTAAVGLFAVVILTWGSLAISFCLGIPATGKIARPFAIEQVAQIDVAVGNLEKAAAAMNWDAMPADAEKIAEALGHLTKSSPVLPALTQRNEPPTQDQLRALVKESNDHFQKGQQSIRDKNAGGLEAALRDLRKSFAPLSEAAKRLGH